jgi:hypothetical protein
MIAILDFDYDEAEEKRKFIRSVYLKDQDGDIFYDKLHFKFLQMRMFNKTADELETHFDKWMYFLNLVFCSYRFSDSSSRETSNKPLQLKLVKSQLPISSHKEGYFFAFSFRK